MEYKKNLSEPWFTLIKIGIKKYEGRLRKGDFEKINKGDFIIFNSGKRSFKAKVTEIKYYSVFKKFISDKGLKKCLPGIDSVKEGVEVYEQFYSKEDIKKYGVVSIRMKVL